MDEKFSSQYTITNFKRKRKTEVTGVHFKPELRVEKPSHKYKRILLQDGNESLSESSSSTTPLYSSHIKHEMALPVNDSLSSDENSSLTSKYPYSVKNEPKAFHDGISAESSYHTFHDDQDTFRVDISRYRNFTTSSQSKSNFLNTDLLNFDSPLTKMEASSSPARVQRNRRNRNHIFKQHRHNKTVTVTLVPCKGPACQSQICCAQFCSQQCFTNQMRPIGTGCLKNAMMDYENGNLQEFNANDYGLHYPDHTYCRHHKNVFFSSELNLDSPPYCAVVEKLFYDEKEQRIKNPRPEPNINGDPISSNGYINPSNKRGRPKRSNVIGLLDPYIFHPSTDVVYTPFVFKECIIKADRISNQLRSTRPIKDAIRQCSNLYKDIRSDVPPEVIYSSNVCVSHNQSVSRASLDGVKRENVVNTHTNSVIDDLFNQDDDDDDDEDEEEEEEEVDFSLQ